MANKRNRSAARTIRLGLGAFLLLLVVGYGATFLQQQKSIASAQARIDELNKTLSDLQLTASALESDLEFSKTDAYIERIAREELGYVRNGEIKFVEGESAAGLDEPQPIAQQPDAQQPDDQ